VKAEAPAVKAAATEEAAAPARQFGNSGGRGTLAPAALIRTVRIKSLHVPRTMHKRAGGRGKPACSAEHTGALHNKLAPGCSAVHHVATQQTTSQDSERSRARQLWHAPMPMLRWVFRAAGKPTVAYKMPREGERIPRSKGVYVEFHIDNHREGPARLTPESGVRTAQTTPSTAFWHSRTRDGAHLRHGQWDAACGNMPHASHSVPAHVSGIAPLKRVG
jgi:hypothetical protein